MNFGNQELFPYGSDGGRFFNNEGRFFLIELTKQVSARRNDIIIPITLMKRGWK
jgi:hypothetical protein